MAASGASVVVTGYSGELPNRNIIESRAYTARLEETSDVTRIFRYLPVLVLILFCIQVASAQSTFDFNFGLGAAQDKAATGGIDTSSSNLGACSSATVAGYCQQPSSLSGVMIGVER